jgi:acyl-CoA synthetase (AMP-forming)/AMP-acid ligase II
MASLGRLLVEKFTHLADHPALADAGCALTYRELARVVTAVEHALRSAGLTQDEPVIVPVANEPRDIIIRGGANVSPLELDHLLAQHPTWPRRSPPASLIRW